MSVHDEDLIFEVGDEEGGGIGSAAGTVIRLDASQIHSAFQHHFEAAIGSVRRAALDTAHEGVLHAMFLTSDEDLVYLSNYIRAFHAVETEDGAMMYNDAPYAQVIEYGRLPGSPGPPLEPIAEWVANKLGIDDPGVAWRIRQKIHDEGTRPRWVMLRAQEEMEQRFPLALHERLSRR